MREFGLAETMPTVATAWGALSRAIRLASVIIRTAPWSASRLTAIGVVPAWASCPLTVIS